MYSKELSDWLESKYPYDTCPLDKPDRYSKHPVIFRNIIENIDEINTIYKKVKACDSLNHGFCTTKSGALQKCAYNAFNWQAWEIRAVNGALKGIILIVAIGGKCWVFKFGHLVASKDSTYTGKKAFAKFNKICKQFGINLDDYAIDNGEQVKTQIESPIIYAYPKYCCQKIEHVYHIDFNKAYPSCMCDTYPEFEPVFKYIVDNVKDGKMVVDPVIGYMQSKHCDFKYSQLSKSAINGNNRKIWDLRIQLLARGFKVIMINTDGIYYYDPTGQNRVYHDDNEGVGLHKWKYDYQDVTFYAESTGQYYLIDNGKVIIKMRGNYLYSQVKPYDTWDSVEDFNKALTSEVKIEWNTDEGFVILNRNGEIYEKE